MIEFSRYELLSILGWMLNKEDKIKTEIRKGRYVDTTAYECAVAIKERCLCARREKDNNEITMEFSKDELEFVLGEARYQANLAACRKFDLVAVELAQNICNKASGIYSEYAA